MTIQIIEDIRNYIAIDKISLAIQTFRENCTEYANELIIQSNKYKNLKSDIRKGIISREQSNLERNRLCNNLLELLNEVDIKKTQPKNAEHHLNSELRDILGLAELISRRKGKERTSTRDFFTALVTMNPSSLQNMISELSSKHALPKPENEEILGMPRKLSNNRVLSGCLTESLKELGEVTSETSTISTADMFIDVSKFGKGKSVAKLRSKGIDSQVIDHYVDEFGITIVKRNDDGSEKREYLHIT